MNINTHKIRTIKNHLATVLVGLGGVSVIVFIALIMFYLLYVVTPLFKGAEFTKQVEYQFPGATTPSLYLAMDEYADTGVRLTDDAHLVAFHVQTGVLIYDRPLIELNTKQQISSLGKSHLKRGIFALGLSNGRVKAYKLKFNVTYPNDVRHVEPVIEYPLGEDTYQIAPDEQALLKIAIQDNEENATIAAITSDKHLLIHYLSKEQSFLDESVEIQQEHVEVDLSQENIDFMLLDESQINLFLFNKNGNLLHYDLSSRSEPKLIRKINLLEGTSNITTVKFLTGDLSVLVGTDNGLIQQWTLLRDEENVPKLTLIRQFQESQEAIKTLSPEYSRKGFIASNSSGNIGIFHTTANRTLLFESAGSSDIVKTAISPRADALLIENNQNKMQLWSIDNEHPEISWRSLWGKVWYESYNEPEYIWQSSSASDDFEPKFSLIPISFGTLKAAFYAMLLAIPLSLMGAIYTAHFMAPKMRNTVKPTIEIMEALPTVILGFLAGLWLAPYVEAHLPGIFAILVILPVVLLLTSFVWTRHIAKRIPFNHEGWEAAILLPIVIITIVISVSISPALESFFFGGDIRVWLTHEMGVGFDQRNAIIVGLAMGFAVIPTIFSIAEDAVFGVPKYLVLGSLALGATPWQTMMRVVLLTASPGIFSGIMIGLGRAVGETMIVLMATGNTPVMDFSPFEGLRTLSANIAVELPESEVDSTHFRVLFLAGLVLFGFTFMVNTFAEIIRQRLRKKYSSL